MRVVRRSMVYIHGALSITYDKKKSSQRIYSKTFMDWYFMSAILKLIAKHFIKLLISHTSILKCGGKR